MRYLLFIFFFISIMACAGPSVTVVHDLSLFFDMNAYLDNYLDTMPEELSVRKIVEVGAQSEEKQIERYNIRKDLDFFRKADIYDPIFTDKYTIDSSINGVKKYISSDEDLFVLSLQVFRTVNRVDSISVTTRIKSMISEQVNHLHFAPSGSYSIFTVEDAIFKDPVERLIWVDFR